MDGINAFVVEAELALDDDCDPAAVGAAVTTELCGHWEHEGPCRWPHNNAIEMDEREANLRTVFVAGDSDAAQVSRRIESSLRQGVAWQVRTVWNRRVSEAEESQAQALLTGPRRP